jgi:hypothetical protein
MNYPLWNLFLTMLWLFIWIVLIVLVIWAILSIIRSHDLSGWGKAGWLIVVILVPFIGVFAYLIARGAHLAGEQVETANAPLDEAARTYERFEAQGKGSADELAKLANCATGASSPTRNSSRARPRLLASGLTSHAGRHDARQGAAEDHGGSSPGVKGVRPVGWFLPSPGFRSELNLCSRSALVCLPAFPRPPGR